MLASLAAVSVVAGPASHAHPVASKRPRNQTPHAYAVVTGAAAPRHPQAAKAQKCTPWKYAIRSRSYYLTKKPTHSFVTAVDKKPMLLMHNLDIGRGMLTVIAFSCSLRGRNQSQSCCKPSLGRQAPARRRTLIPSTLLRGTPRAEALRSFYILV